MIKNIQKASLSTLILTFFVFTISLMAIALSYTWLKASKIILLSGEVQQKALYIKKKLLQENQNKQTRERFLNPEHEYIENYLENLSINQNRTFGEKSQLAFHEKKVFIKKDTKETIIALNQPIEVNLIDLETILNAIEDDALSKGRKPQLIITRLDLDKNVAASQNMTLELDLEILKREFLDK